MLYRSLYRKSLNRARNRPIEAIQHTLIVPAWLYLIQLSVTRNGVYTILDLEYWNTVYNSTLYTLPLVPTFVSLTQVRP